MPLSLSSSTPPQWRIDRWFNTPAPLTLQALRGRVIVVLVFQMLCPGCVAHALPLAARVHDRFPRERVAMIGLHTVFEHHAAMTPIALAAFLHEYRIAFPVGVDHADGLGPIPATMRAYAMRGTPTWLLFDPEGRLHGHWFGEIDPLRLGADIGVLLARPRLIGDGSAQGSHSAESPSAAGCDDGVCRPDENRG